MITDGSKIAEIFYFSKYFSNIVPDLGFEVADDWIHQMPKNKGPIVNATSEYQNRPSIKIILPNCKNRLFFFSKLQH